MLGVETVANVGVCRTPRLACLILCQFSDSGNWAWRRVRPSRFETRSHRFVARVAVVPLPWRWRWLGRSDVLAKFSCDFRVQVLGEADVAGLAGPLVTKGHVRCLVAQPVHQLREGRAGLCRQSGCGPAEIVDMDVAAGEAGDSQRRLETSARKFPLLSLPPSGPVKSNASGLSLT